MGYSKNLLHQLKNSNNIELAQLMKKVGKGVQVETGPKQVPWISSSITGDFYFSGKSLVPAGEVAVIYESAPTTLNEEEEFWKVIKN